MTRVNSDERQKIEICVEPSTSSAEPSPVVKRSQRYDHIPVLFRLAPILVNFVKCNVHAFRTYKKCLQTLPVGNGYAKRKITLSFE